jgi:lipopolysaccharide biosynthesis glycosyltransferase
MIRVFIGTQKMHEKAEKALVYSIQKNTNEEVKIQLLRNLISWQTPPTGFSSHRYMIPQLCNYEGYAIHLDVDMLVLGDIKELWDYKTPGRWCVTSKRGGQGVRDEVSVIDCSAFRDLPKEGELKTSGGKTAAKQIIGKRYLANIPIAWNAMMMSPCNKGYCACPELGCAKRPEPQAENKRGPATDETKLIHYTNLRTQPWHPNPKQKYLEFPCKQTEDLFWEYLEEANKNV